MKKLSLLLATITVFASTGFTYVSLKNIAIKRDTKEEQITKEINVLKEELKQKQKATKDLKDNFNSRVAKINSSNNEIKKIEKEVNTLNDQLLINNDQLKQLSSDSIRINKELKNDIDQMNNNKVESDRLEKELKEVEKQIYKVLIELTNESNLSEKLNKKANDLIK
ncbi:hypothetical protein FOY66_04545 [Mycoplasma capricolum subsp. capripneumoniae]|uniref:hypothetical protein n=1 Tax=Mycoplasma capricolum TaxID=2095 RepID=UPI0004F8C3B9|nr:hypothetical protein [Mycoplasma capricolum]QDL19928.1 hypothetical protein DQW15_04580 [Mycoplasma capricolum subsp. capripneumoniae]QDL20613.1 hypothetical protein DQW16_04580 [Mycoplasma capricolum subsp. capripneumoniae]QDL21299.1 hypothetical protein DQW17_04575 [Mycoplasma capricolum subsp. capripneumoniae]QIN42707.1 hypothetical protein FOY62_04545 [Mycoplasma capricolum subsp. capripneumoniae]QIN45448.1 hypothetical protein FOY66_04545 [Mycoplasma capricolum subsp. capripneumoniae]